jgi:DnaJ-domain-containing protein 1
MTDYFVLLQQPRQPWLEPDQLKQRYQELTLAQHPDRKGASESSVDFAQVNDAYRVLADPKLRLQHLLQLSGTDPNTDQAIPQELLDLFTRIGNFVQKTDHVLQRVTATQNALAQSLIRPEIAAQQKEAEALLEKTRRLYDDAIEEIRSLNETWAQVPQQLAQLFRRFAYLTRWIQQLEERQFQLAPVR